MPRIKRKHQNIEGESIIDLLPFNQESLEKIRLEREYMATVKVEGHVVEGAEMNLSEIDHYLTEGFTIITYQADYVLEGYDFAYDE